MEIRCQGKRTKKHATAKDVLRAVHALTRPNGPTYVIVEVGNGDYAQAAGTYGRYVVESRIAFGEGFRHLRVVRPWPEDDHEVAIHYDCGSCKKHQLRRCPLRVQASEVCNLSHVERALVAFVQTGTQTRDLEWRDVTAEFTKKADDDAPISTIIPRSPRHA